MDLHYGMQLFSGARQNQNVFIKETAAGFAPAACNDICTTNILWFTVTGRRADLTLAGVHERNFINDRKAECDSGIHCVKLIAIEHLGTLLSQNCFMH